MSMPSHGRSLWISAGAFALICALVFYSWLLYAILEAILALAYWIIESVTLQIGMA